MGLREMFPDFGLKTLKGRSSCRLEQNLGVDLVAEGGRVLSGFIWIRVGDSD